MRLFLVIALSTASFAAVAANPRYVWTGGAGVAESGDYAGTYLWSDANNWTNALNGANEVPVAGASGSANSTVLDFTDLEANATITFDSSVQYFLSSMTFGAGKGTQTLAMGVAASGYVTSIENGTTITVPSGTTVDFRLNKPQNTNGSGATHTFTGGGTFRISSATFSAYRVRCSIAANTTLELNSAAADFRTAYVSFEAATARLVLSVDAKIGAIVGSTEAAPGQVNLNGHTLEYGMNAGPWATTSDYGWLKNAKCKVWTDAVGTGKLIYSGAAVYTNMVSQSVAGSLKLMNADVAMADGASFTGSPALEIGSGGILTLGANQTVATLAGNGTTGGVEIPSGKTLTVTGAASGTTNYNATLSGAGGFVKNGNDELVLCGKNTMTGPMTIGAGTLTAKGSAATVAAEEALVHGYSFEDSLADNKTSGGTTAVFNYRVNNTDASSPPEGATASSFCEGRRGTRGVEMFSGANASVYVANGGSTGTGPFTATFWMVPATNICIRSVNSGMTILEFIGSGNDGAYKRLKVYLVNGTNLNFSVGAYTIGRVEDKDGLGFSTNIAWKTLYDGRWHMVTATYSGDGTKILSGYFDGELVGSKAVETGTLDTSNGRLHLGWGANSGSIAGKFDDWKYLSRCQTAAEVAAEFRDAVTDGDDYAALPAPVAEWKFDDASNPGKDTSGNGYDLSVPDGYEASSVDLEGAYGKALAADSVLYWADSENFPSKIPVENAPWTLSVRYQVGMIREAGNYNNPSIFYWGDPLGYTGTSYTEADWKYFSATIRNDDGYRYWCAGFKANSNAYHTPTANMMDITYSGITGRFAWTHIVYVYVPLDGLYMYQDGRFVQKTARNLAYLKKKDIFVGLRPQYGGKYELAQFNGNIDDIRMWDVSLSADQVRTLVRGMKEESSPSPLSADSDVTVASGATLKVEGTGVAAKSISGAGTLNVTDASTLTVGGGSMTGELTGRGELRLTAPFKVSVASNYYGNVVLSGTGALDAPGFGQQLDLPDPYSAALASTAALPLVRTSGKVKLPQSLAVSFAERPAPGTYLFAEANALDMPASLASWTVQTDGTLSARFVEEDGKVYLKVRDRGTIMIVR